MAFELQMIICSTRASPLYYLYILDETMHINSNVMFRLPLVIE